VDDFDALVANLQAEVDRDTQRVYSDKVFQRWQNPTHVGRMGPADAWSRVTGGCGDTMEIYLEIREDRILRASACTDGCGTSMVCGSMAAEMAEGKHLEEAIDIRGEDVLAALDGLPEEDVHCAFLAAETLREAVHAFLAEGDQVTI
jgi:nitrogen fixation NifU-like protein